MKKVSLYSLGVLLIGLCFACKAKPPINTNPCGDSCPATSECVEGTYCLTKCPKGTTRCGLLCTNLQLDQNHCGACGKPCKFSERCTAGSCQGLTPCEIDPKNCPKTCKTPCPSGKTCRGGLCLCPKGQVDCNGICTLLNNSAKHCGACGQACPASATCQQGKCQCPSGTIRCGNQCITTENNDKHCGACNNDCGAGRFCDIDKCVCTNNKSDCNGVCVDAQADPNHCGSCGKACTRKQSCQQGKCQCPTGEELCGGACTNTNTDSTHCGACGKACLATELCVAGQCKPQPKCKDGKAECNKACVDLNQDNKHCGSCGTACQANEDCIDGTCKLQRCNQGEVKCGSTCALLANNATHCGGCNRSCLATQRCFNSRCVPICPKGQTLCGLQCVTLQTDDKHCGGCNKQCPSGSRCQNGQCASFCTKGLSSCPGGCVNFQVDTANCGACGTKCVSCTNGVCNCNSNQLNCNNICVNFLTDTENCGGCGNKCKTGELCEQGKCGVFTKKAWYPDRDNDGHGDKSASPLMLDAKAPAPAGYVANKTDCCDKDANAKPGQTKHYSTQTACGGYDYNCDGKETVLQNTCTCSQGLPTLDQSKLQYQVTFTIARYINGRNVSVVVDTQYQNATSTPPASAPKDNRCLLSTLRYSYGITRAMSYSFSECGNPTLTLGATAKVTTALSRYIMWDKSKYKAGCFLPLAANTKLECGKLAEGAGPLTESDIPFHSLPLYYSGFSNCYSYMTIHITGSFRASGTTGLSEIVSIPVKCQ